MNFVRVLVFVIVMSLVIFATMYFIHRGESSPTDENDFFDGVSALSQGATDGLVIDDVKRGSGKKVAESDRVEVHYIGALKDGTVFDSSRDRDRPFSFTVGEGRVIRGWEMGVLGMKEGGVRMVVIPPELGYGSRSQGPIPPDSTLIFEIELLSIGEED